MVGDVIRHGRAQRVVRAQVRAQRGQAQHVVRAQLVVRDQVRVQRGRARLLEPGMVEPGMIEPSML